MLGVVYFGLLFNKQRVLCTSVPERKNFKCKIYFLFSMVLVLIKVFSSPIPDPLGIRIHHTAIPST
jgi:hypothetical protein